MSIVYYELKKIWNWKIVLAILAFSVMFYYMFLHFYIEHYPNGHPATEDVYLSELMTERYGSQITPDVMDEFYTQMYHELVRQADAIIAGDDAARDAGITDYSTLLATKEKIFESEPANDNEAMEITSDKVFQASYKLWNYPEYDYVLYKLDALSGIRNRYDLTDEDWNLRFDYSTTDLSLRRWHEIRDTGEGLSIIPGSLVQNNLIEYVMNLSWLIIFAICILHSPLITSDKLRNMRLLQYSSKSGRKLLGKQFTAVILSSFILTTVLMLVFGGIYSLNGTHIFWDNYVSSFNASIIISLPLTYGQYVIILIVMLYLLGITVSAVTFVLSQLCSNYIPLIAGGVCTCIAVIFLCGYIVFTAPLSRWIYYVEIALFEPLILVTLALLGFAAAAYFINRERKIDIV